MKKSYGHFEDATREYVITDPMTPVKWVNYIGSLDFGGIVDHTGGSLLCAGDPGLNRITKYIPQMPASDFKGTTLYLRVVRPSGIRVIAPFFVPCLDEMDHYECRVGLSYQRIVGEVAGVRAEVTIFVPPGVPMEIRYIRVINTGEDYAEIDVVPVVEYSHFDALKQLSNADWVPQTMMSEAMPLHGGRLALLQFPFMRKGGAVNFLSSSHPVHSFESDRKRFLGANEYGTWRCPLSLLDESLSNHQARRGDNIGALRIPLGTIQPGESKQVATFLGQAKAEQVAGLVSFFSNLDEVDRALVSLSEFWDVYLSAFQCKTPDAGFDSMVNIHNPRQCYMTMNWSRYLSLYQLGIGTRGLGFRDSSQDVMGGMVGAPETALVLIRKLLSIQRPEGAAMHQFYPATMHADCGDAEEEKDKGKLIYGDDHLWIVLAVSAYLQETGNMAFLEEQVPFYQPGLPPAGRAAAPVFEHLVRALEYSKTHVGKHGLPLLGYADWNDTVNLPGAAESMFNACLYGKALLEMASICLHLGLDDLAEGYMDDHAAMKERVNTCGWDGEWFVRYFTEAGEPLGSKSNAYGKIYTNAQSWPVIAGFATSERAKTAMDSVEKHLNTRFGIKLSGPGFDRYDPTIGGITTYPPGAKENGGIFLHSNPWVMIAETMIGRGDKAYQYYCQINPAKRNDDVDLFEVEPYCYPQNILGDEHPQFGLGRNSWLSGTASWTYQAATKHILGVRPSLGGLVVDPCIPEDWPEFEVIRRFRGATYRIRVENSGHVSHGVASMTVDGEPVMGNVIPLFDCGTHDINVTLGRSVTHPAQFEVAASGCPTFHGQ